MLNRLLFGNAGKVENQEAVEKFSHLLTEGETFLHSYKIVRDYFLFTEERLITVDFMGITGTRVSYKSIPYHSIQTFEIETAGILDLNAHLRIMVQGYAEPIAKQFGREVNIFEVQKVLTEAIIQGQKRK
jgi:hypothetical protein